MQDGKYLTYAEYVSLGGKLDCISFLELEFEARKNIDRCTFGRLKNLKNQVEEVKRCVFKLVGIINSYSNDRDKSISSENIDGYVVNYNTSNISENKHKEIDSIIFNYLSDCTLDDGTFYLYRGR